MPVSIFAMLVFGICTWLGLGVIESVMRDFAGEVGVRIWVFVIVPGLFAMLYGLLLFRKAAIDITTLEQSASRALTVAIATWITVTALVSYMWCPAGKALGCTMNVALVTGIIGGGPLLVACLIAGGIIGIVLKNHVAWLTYPAAARPVDVPAPAPAPVVIAMPKAVDIPPPDTTELGSAIDPPERT
jgi:hypothetical protein